MSDYRIGAISITIGMILYLHSIGELTFFAAYGLLGGLAPLLLPRGG